MRISHGLLVFVAAGAAGSISGIAAAQPTACQGVTGPDVTVASLMALNNGNDTTGQVKNYVATGGYDAFSMGTYSLNVGTVWLNWFDFNNQHPVIAQNCFKYKVVNGSGRFEQIGQSWLKHGFYALSDTIWCPVCTATDGTHLGVGCSDPYTADRNGGQSLAGPKWQVNANTGAFTYPPANPSFSGTMARRLRIATTDLEPSSAAVRFFGEGQYVSPDDATAGHQDNNVSYRELVVTGTTDYTFNFNAPIAGNDYKTRRELPAIKAWKTLEPAVTETTFDIPAEGRVIVSSRATDLGGGIWHYEYAVYNMNSDLCVGTFSVPVPDSATVTNIGFRDVSYFDGDGINSVNFDGTNWSSSRSGNKIAWSTKSFAADANANAIRWGTMYNFRFDANIAPAASGNASMSTWKVVTAYDMAAQVPGAASVSCYANCDASTAVPFLNVNDFTCFLNSYAAGSSSANCDGSTAVPVLDVNDFTCFTNAYAAGCANP